MKKDTSARGKNRCGVCQCPMQPPNPLGLAELVSTLGNMSHGTRLLLFFFPNFILSQVDAPGYFFYLFLLLVSASFITIRSSVHSWALLGGKQVPVVNMRDLVDRAESFFGFLPSMLTPEQKDLLNPKVVIELSDSDDEAVAPLRGGISASGPSGALANSGAVPGGGAGARAVAHPAGVPPSAGAQLPVSALSGSGSIAGSDEIGDSGADAGSGLGGASAVADPAGVPSGAQLPVFELSGSNSVAERGPVAGSGRPSVGQTLQRLRGDFHEGHISAEGASWVLGQLLYNVGLQRHIIRGGDGAGADSAGVPLPGAQLPVAGAPESPALAPGAHVPATASSPAIASVAPASPATTCDLVGPRSLVTVNVAAVAAGGAVCSAVVGCATGDHGSGLGGHRCTAEANVASVSPPATVPLHAPEVSANTTTASPSVTVRQATTGSGSGRRGGGGAKRVPGGGRGGGQLPSGGDRAGGGASRLNVHREWGRGGDDDDEDEDEDEDLDEGEGDEHSGPGSQQGAPAAGKAGGSGAGSGRRPVLMRLKRGCDAKKKEEEDVKSGRGLQLVPPASNHRQSVGSRKGAVRNAGGSGPPVSGSSTEELSRRLENAALPVCPHCSTPCYVPMTGYDIKCSCHQSFCGFCNKVGYITLSCKLAVCIISLLCVRCIARVVSLGTRWPLRGWTFCS